MSSMIDEALVLFTSQLKAPPRSRLHCGPYTRTSASNPSAAKTAAAIKNQMLASRCRIPQPGRISEKKITASTGQIEQLRDGILSGAAGRD